MMLRRRAEVKKEPNDDVEENYVIKRSKRGLLNVRMQELRMMKRKMDMNRRMMRKMRRKRKIVRRKE